MYNWTEITSLAYLSLIELNIVQFPVSENKIKCKGVIITSYQVYSNITGMSIEEISLGGELNDAFLLKELRPELSLVLYDESTYDARRKHTLWHEIGHIKCKHQEHGETEEVEAHYFASQVLAPNAIIRAIAQRGYPVNNIDFLMKCFGISKESAGKKLDYLNKYGFEHTNENDDILLLQFKDYINVNYPLKTKYIHDDFLDEMEKNRASW